MYSTINAEYDGILFGSKLEARWAIFFDALDIKYYYNSHQRCFDLKEMKRRFYIDDNITNSKKMLKSLMSLNAFDKYNTVFIGDNKLRLSGHALDLVPQNADSNIGYGQGLYMKCKECNKWYFSHIYDDWTCPHCEHYSGDSTAVMIYADEFEKEEYNRQDDIEKDEYMELYRAKRIAQVAEFTLVKTPDNQMIYMLDDIIY